MTPPFPVSYRLSTEADVSFIWHSWVHDEKLAILKQIPWLSVESYMKDYGEHINKVIKKHPIVVAYNPDDEEQIYGWRCPGVGYGYVKKSFRLDGELMEAMIEEGSK